MAPTVRTAVRLGRPALAGVALAFAWVCGAILFGAASDAYAGDGLLGDTVSIREAADARDPVAESVADVARGFADVEQVVEPVEAVVPSPGAPADVPDVPAVAPDVPAVAPVVEDVAPAVRSAPVVGAVVEPAVTAVSGVAESADDAVRAVIGGVRGTIDVVEDVVDDLVDREAGGPGTSAPVGDLPSDGVAPAALPSPADEGAVDDGAAADAAGVRRTASAGAASVIVWVSGVPVDVASPAPSPPLGGGLCPAQLSASSGSAGGAWALLAVFPVAAHRAWVRRRGAGDDGPPPSPFFDGDVSPD